MVGTRLLGKTEKATFKSINPKPAEKILVTKNPVPTPVPSLTTQTNLKQTTKLEGCIDKSKIDIFVYPPFTRTNDQVLEYFKSSGLTLYNQPSPQEYIISLPLDKNGDEQINKLKADGFTSVKYWRVVGCDIVR